jgi:hypothetical protein
MEENKTKKKVKWRSSSHYFSVFFVFLIGVSVHPSANNSGNTEKKKMVTGCHKFRVEELY